MPRILIGCECSGIMREAFKARGWDAWSCDTQSTEIPGNHIKGDVRKYLNEGWDMTILHPPCTYLSNVGLHLMYTAKHPLRHIHQEKAIEFFMELWNAPIRFLALENPAGIMSTEFRKPDQYVCPTWFGHKETKRTGLWLKNLPLLVKTEFGEREARYVSPKGKTMSMWFAFANGLRGKARQKFRSRTFQGVANAMADQWGWYVEGILLKEKLNKVTL
jgi:hypothetical protein